MRRGNLSEAEVCGRMLDRGYPCWQIRDYLEERRAIRAAAERWDRLYGGEEIPEKRGYHAC